MPDFHTLIVGAGFSGIGTAIAMDKAGLRDYLILEAGDEASGTWFWNTYPVWPWTFRRSPISTRSSSRGAGHAPTRRRRAAHLRRQLRRQVRFADPDRVQHHRRPCGVR